MPWTQLQCLLQATKTAILVGHVVFQFFSDAFFFSSDVPEDVNEEIETGGVIL